jgi:hypothetical protein
MAKSKELRIRIDNCSESISMIIDYFNQLGSGKNLILLQAIKAFYYTEISFEKKFDSDADEIQQSLSILETRLIHLKQLADIKLKKTIDISLPQVGLSTKSQVSSPVVSFSNPTRTSHVGEATISCGDAPRTPTVSSCEYGDDDSVEMTQSNSDLDDFHESTANLYDDGL